MFSDINNADILPDDLSVDSLKTAALLRRVAAVAGAPGLLRPAGSVQGRRCGDLPTPQGVGAEEWPCSSVVWGSLWLIGAGEFDVYTF